MWSDARRHSAVSATGKWSFSISAVLLLCFDAYSMVLYVLCYSCANNLGFLPDVRNAALPVPSSVQVSLSSSHSNFKNVCKHTCQHTKKQLPLPHSSGAKGSHVQNANSCELADMWHITFAKNFYLIKEYMWSSGEDPVNAGRLDSWGQLWIVIVGLYNCDRLATNMEKEVYSMAVRTDIRLLLVFKQAETTVGRVLKALQPGRWQQGLMRWELKLKCK